MIKTRLVHLLSHAKKYIVYNIVWQWIALLAQIAAIFTVSSVIGALLFPDNGSLPAFYSVLILAVCTAIRFICDRLAVKASSSASMDVKRILREQIYEKLLRLGPSYKEQVSTAEVVQLSTEGVEQLETYFGKYISQLFYSLLAPVTLFIVLSRVNMRASVILLICVPLIPVSIVVVQKIAKKLLSKYWGIYTSLGDSFLENLQGLTTLKIYQADEKKAKEMDAESEKFRKVTMKVLTMQLNSTSVMDIVAYGGAAIGMVTAVSQFLSGALSFSGALTICLLASEFFLPLRLLGSYFHIAMNGMAASDKIFALLDLPEPENGSLGLDKSSIGIQLRDLHFSYETEREILNGISLDLPSGSFVSLVGESGCGKSTIASLLSGKLRSYSGEILIEGKSLKELDISDLQNRVTVVRHNSHIFKGTVEENLRPACPNAPQSKLEEALEKVNLLAFFQAQDGLMTQLNEGGSNLSGGQRQRLALARALLHDSPVYIFDEATSNIDAESEKQIMSVIHGLAGKHTVLLISHRLSNVVNAEAIYMLKDGRIVEAGSHEELLAKKGAYSRLYRTQHELESYAAEELGGFKALEETVPDSLPAKTSAKPHRGEKKRRGGLAIMAKLIVLVKPLIPVMLVSVALGTIGYLCAIFLTILASQGLLHGLSAAGASIFSHTALFANTPVASLLTVLVIIAVARGFLHYIEQYCNHYIAFKLLAIIRHKVFAQLRKLCPAKLEGQDKGNLISLLTTDIELLEVFYAHTISPIAIALLCSLIMVVFLGQYSPWAALLALCAYLLVGFVLPIWNGRRGAEPGMRFRESFGALNSFVLDSLRGLDETIQYSNGIERKSRITARSNDLAGLQKKLSRLEASQRSVTDLVILLFSYGMLFLSLCLLNAGQIGLEGVLTCTVTMMGSFGPVVALSGLSNNLNQTLASGERVLSLLEESAQVEEIPGAEKHSFTGAEVEKISFSYDREAILTDFSLRIRPGQVIGIHGPSGCGKSTLLKLLMRFWDVEKGCVSISQKNINELPTAALRNMESYVTQETHLFHDSIANNIELGRPGASREDIIRAAKMAAIHDFIMSLPKNYDTEVGELGDTLSGGERQRIGLARAFLHDAPFLLLDEPTSNLDSLNEGIILKSLNEFCADKTVILVSHRKSTLNGADEIINMKNGRIS